VYEICKLSLVSDPFNFFSNLGVKNFMIELFSTMATLLNIADKDFEDFSEI